ncbi:MAG: hypothetical protein ACRENJ_00615 [Candidatus Eiseniibacteriota bacterium]
MARAFLAPERDPLWRQPGFRQVAWLHQRLTRGLTFNFVAIRQEEHRAFLARVAPEGQALRALVVAGRLPGDLHVAIDCVGAIPYYSDLPTLDRLGLADAVVAHSKVDPGRMLGHDKLATVEYARRRGVELWAVDPVHVLFHAADPDLKAHVRSAAERATASVAAEIAPGWFLVGDPLTGLAALRKRLPAVRIEALGDSSFLGRD